MRSQTEWPKLQPFEPKPDGDVDAVYLMVVGLNDLSSSYLSLGIKWDMECGIHES